MKRVLAFLAVSAAILAVSCNKEQDNQGREEGNLATVSFTVSQADLMTKADPVDPKFGDATKVNELLVQVFNKVGNDFVKLDAPEMTIAPVSGASPLAWHVDMKLAKNETYKIAFWAQKSGNGIYNTTNLSNVTIDYSKVAINNDNADAFCAARFVTVTGSLSEKVLLYRPLAQINIGTNDLASYQKSVVADKQNLTATITLPVGTPNKLNVIGGAETNGVVSAAVSGNTTEETAFTTAPDYVMEGMTLISGGKTYDYLAMLYVLAAPGKETMTFKAKLNNSATDVSDITVSNMPYQANYRTNIVGQLLTGSFEFNVEVEEGFYADFEKKVAPTFASVAALNAYFETMADNSDNGDIDPEEVVISANAVMGDEEEIILPKIAGKVVISVLANSKTLTFKYAEGATAEQKPAFVDLYLSKVQLLVINLDASHVECLAGDIVAAQVITGPDTFVIKQGAKVGTAEIQKGNAKVEGTVDAIVVEVDTPTESLELFLSKDAAVKTITLNSPTDVVVEQPKDNIVADTDNKVEVLVNVNNCSATAQNGGQIYVAVKDGVTCSVIADGKDGENKSTVTISDAGAGVTASTNNEGVVNHTSGVDDEEIINVNGVAKVNGKLFETLQAAVDAATDGDVIDILKDIALTTVSTTVNGESNVKYNVVVDKGVTINGNNHAITASSKKRPLALAGNDKTIVVKDLTINVNGGTPLWLIANNMTATLDNVVVDGTNCTEEYKQVVTIGFGFEGIEFNVTNGSVIKTNNAGSAHYDIIAWSPAKINVANSTLKGWANVYLKPTAGGSVVNISNSFLQSQGSAGSSNEFALLSVECAGNTITLDNNTAAISEAVGNTFNTLINVSEYWAAQSNTTATDNKFYILNNTVFTGDGTKYTGLVSDAEWSAFIEEKGNVIYFDESTVAAFASMCEYNPDVLISETADSQGLYSLTYSPEVFYYWQIGENQYQGVYCSLKDPFGDSFILSPGEFIRLLKDVTLKENIVCQLSEYLPKNSSVNLILGEFNITKGNYSIQLPDGLSIITDKQVEIFSVSAEDAALGCFIKEFEIDGGGYEYKLQMSITGTGEGASGFQPGPSFP